MKILVTGDDGLKSPGIMLLGTILKSMGHKIIITSPREPASSIGGAISLWKEAILWGKIDLDIDVEAIWIMGTPVDAVELSHHLYPGVFDLVIAGLNFGPNLGPAIISSGTFCSVLRTLGLGMTLKGMAISWDCPPNLWQHQDLLQLENLMKNPGKMLMNFLTAAFKENLWDCELLNVNLPKDYTDQIAFTSHAETIGQSYDYNLIIQPDRFRYNIRGVAPSDVSVDAGAINHGLISVTPCNPNFTDQRALKKIINQP